MFINNELYSNINKEFYKNNNDKIENVRVLSNERLFISCESGNVYIYDFQNVNNSKMFLNIGLIKLITQLDHNVIICIDENLGDFYMWEFSS